MPGNGLDVQKEQDSVNIIFKAWKWFLWGLRWFSVLVFSILFCVGLVLSLPWKMLVCFTIIPVTVVFLPKKAESWVWVCLTGIVLGLYIWVMLPELNKEAWKPYQFEQDLETIRNHHWIPGVPNAADLYQPLFEQYGETIFGYPFSVDIEKYAFRNIWNPAEYPDLNEWTDVFEPAAERFIAASQTEQCQFDIPHDLPSLGPHMQRVNQCKGWARMLIRSANRDLFAGRKEEALEKMLAVLSLAGHLYQQKTLFDQAGAFHIELFASGALKRFMIDYCDDPETLSRIEQAYEKLDPDWAGGWPDIVALLKLHAKNLVGTFYEVNPDGKTRMSRNAIPALAGGLGYRVPRVLMKQNISKMLTIGMWLFLPASPEHIGKVIDKRFDYYSLQVQKGEQVPKIPARYMFILNGLNFKSVIDWLAIEQAGFFWALNDDYLKHQGLVNRMHLYAALKRYRLEYGQWPESLDLVEIENIEDLLLDPVSLTNLVYERRDNEFWIYSIGSNLVDDGGLYEGDGKDDILFWPQRSDKKEEKRPIDKILIE